MNLQTPLQYLPGVGPVLAKKLAKLELFTVEDLIHHYPFRYDDFSYQTQIPLIAPGETVTIQGDIWSIQNIYAKTGRKMTKAIINDGQSVIDLVWFNQPWLTKTLRVGDRLQVSGKVKKIGSRLSIAAPVWEKITTESTSSLRTMNQASNNASLHTGRLVPIYPETFGLSSKWFRQKIDHILPKAQEFIDDPIPEEITQTMIPLVTALKQIHFPDNYQQINKARERLAFDELFYIQLLTQKKRREWQMAKISQPLKIEQNKLTDFINQLPFPLTNAQKRVISEITQDLEKNRPMNRLVQGDVGSGKTVVAATIIFAVYLNNLKAILMAPTEILAFQHYSTLNKLLTPFGIKVGLYTGSSKYTKIPSSKKKKDVTELKTLQIDEQISPDVIVGTHAVLSDKLVLENVGLVVVDEQQRFGVKQRSLLRTKAEIPHFLTMTATPIPRTVALTVYGDLDLSIIDELPKGRKLVQTHFVPQKKRQDAYNFIAEHIKRGEQVYIVTPLIEESETEISAKAAKVEYERLKRDVFPEFRIGLLHGRLKSKEKESVLKQ